jgi:tetratricopeptide (TPR) repeat protein
VRLRTAVVAICMVMVAGPGLGASMKNHDDCDSGAPVRIITACTRVIQDGSKSREVRAIAHVHRGLARQHKGQRYKAMVDYTAAIRLNPNDPFAYSNRALLWHEKQDFDRAIADLSEAARLAPDNPDIGAMLDDLKQGLGRTREQQAAPTAPGRE